jgi:C4-type Zn-finger protein
MIQNSCPRCGEGALRRVKRSGTVDFLLSVFYLYPFGCRECSYRFREIRWGKRYVKYRKAYRPRPVRATPPIPVS